MWLCCGFGVPDPFCARLKMRFRRLLLISLYAWQPKAALQVRHTKKLAMELEQARGMADPDRMGW